MGLALKIAAMVVTVAVFGFMAYIGREEYRIARREGRGRVGSASRAPRVTVDSFVMGH